MMTELEFTGKNVKEAVRNACEQLKVDEALLEVEVIEESTRGFLGIVGQRDARIRVKRRDILREVMGADDSASECDEAQRSADSSEEPAATLIEESVPISVRETQEEEVTPPESSPAMQQAADILREILGRMSMEAQVQAQMVNGAVHLDIMGDGSGLLIGKKGRTLDDLQFIVSKIVNKDNSPADKIKVVIDTENYRARREASLREKALRMSDKAKRTLKPVWLDPMPPNERRIVHMILAEDRGVYTKSHGEGVMRKIVVYPRRLANKRRGR